MFRNSFITNKISFGKFYVYLLIDPRNKQPFYVGKGHGNRYKEHFRNSSLIIEKSSNKEKIKRILEIKNLDLLPDVKFEYFCQNEEEAFDVENFLINNIGTVKEGTGPLLNQLTGESSKVGRCVTNKETLKLMSLIFSGENNPCYGKIGKEHPAFGIKHSKESVKIRCEKLKENLKQNPRLGNKNSNFGNKWNEEQKIKQSNKIKGKYIGVNNPRAKKFLLISPENKEFIVIGGLRNFCKENNICAKIIWEKLRKDIHIHNNWFFKEIKNENTSK